MLHLLARSFLWLTGPGSGVLPLALSEVLGGEGVVWCYALPSQSFPHLGRSDWTRLGIGLTSPCAVLAFCSPAPLSDVAMRLRLDILSLPSWERIPGSISVIAKIKEQPSEYVQNFLVRIRQVLLKKHTFCFCVTHHGKCVGSKWRLHFGVVKVDHRTIVFYKVHLLNREFVNNTYKWTSTVCENKIMLQVLTSSMPGIVFTPSFLRPACSFLSSFVAVRWITFFFRRAEP